MPEDVEIETSELQEAIQELHEEREELRSEAHRQEWTKLIGLSTAILAVFAAIGAMQSGASVNEAMIDQIKASDKWNEYQAARTKAHLYGIHADELADTKPALTAKFREIVNKEEEKGKELMPEARKLESESNHFMHHHHRLANSVAAIQVAIALGAVAALTRSKPIWFIGLAVGAVGIVLFRLGSL